MSTNFWSRRSVLYGCRHSLRSKDRIYHKRTIPFGAQTKIEIPKNSQTCLILNVKLQKCEYFLPCDPKKPQCSYAIQSNHKVHILVIISCLIHISFVHDFRSSILNNVSISYTIHHCNTLSSFIIRSRGNQFIFLLSVWTWYLSLKWKYFWFYSHK